MRVSSIFVLAAVAASFAPPVAVGGKLVIDGRAASTRADGPCFSALTDASQRYADCGNGTVYDPLTGLLWLKHANCAALGPGPNTDFWVEAQASADTVAHGLDCDGDGTPELTDGSQPGDWRLPTIEEWEAAVLRAFGFGCTFSGANGPPSIMDDTGNVCYGTGANSSFVDVVSGFYWSRTSNAADPTLARDMSLIHGVATDLIKQHPTGIQDFIWPVRESGSPSSNGGLQVEGQDADLKANGPCVDSLATSNQRFINCGDGTVFDPVQGLLWLRDARCLQLPGVDPAAGTATWSVAQQATDLLADGLCALADGSQPGDWRTPTDGEWTKMTLAAMDSSFGCTGASAPTVLNATGTDCHTAGPPAFLNLTADDYWSSRIGPVPATAWVADLSTGAVTTTAKTGDHRVWPVRSKP